MKLNNRTNTTLLGGYVSQVDIKNGQFGRFGSVTIAVDDGYRDPQSGSWVDKTQFIRVEVSGKNLPEIGVGDFLELSGKLILDTWEENGGQQRTAMKVRMQVINSHLQKAAIQLLKQNGFGSQPQQQQPQQQPQRRQPQQQPQRRQPQQQQPQQQPQRRQPQQQQPPQQWGYGDHPDGQY